MLSLCLRIRHNHSEPYNYPISSELIFDGNVDSYYHTVPLRLLLPSRFYLMTKLTTVSTYFRRAVNNVMPSLGIPMQSWFLTKTEEFNDLKENIVFEYRDFFSPILWV